MSKQEFIKQMHERLRAAFRTQWSSDGESDRLAKDVLERMYMEIGSERTWAAVKTFIDTEQFFNVAKLREKIPPAERLKPKWVDCSRGCLEGWKPIVDDRGVERMTKCECRRLA